MDYCIPCSRTLNGTVTCPECGAYDSELAQTIDCANSAPTVNATVPKARFGQEPGSRPAQPIDRDNSAPAVNTAVPEVHFGQEPGSHEVPDVSWPPDLPQAAPSAGRNRPGRLKRHAGLALVAAAFTLFGGVATASLLPEQTSPRAARIPEHPIPDESRFQAAQSPTPPEPTATHSSRAGRRGTIGDRPSRPRPTASHRESPTVRTPAATTSSPPPVKADPTPRPPSSRPGSTSRTATPSRSPSVRPSGGVSASPTVSASPSTEGGARG
ncbi:SCO2400 family protein [Streptomyces sp. NPDC003697]